MRPRRGNDQNIPKAYERVVRRRRLNTLVLCRFQEVKRICRERADGTHAPVRDLIAVNSVRCGVSAKITAEDENGYGRLRIQSRSAFETRRSEGYCVCDSFCLSFFCFILICFTRSAFSGFSFGFFVELTKTVPTVPFWADA